MNELRKVDEQLLVGPEGGLRAQVRYLLEEMRSLSGERGAGDQGMLRGLWSFRAGGSCHVGIRVIP